MWILTKNKDWKELQKYAWVNDMNGVPQSPIHHAEGDVAIHTQMVISAILSLEEYHQLNEQEQEILWVAALMHDIEKRSTTFTDEYGDIVSPGHAKKGAQTTRQILYRDFQTPFNIRENIVGLVRHHGLPLWIFEKPNPTQALLKASMEVNTMLVALLAKADVLGRICKDADSLLYKINLFEELCKENNCWGRAKAFSSTLSKFQYFRKEDRHPDFKTFDDTTFEIIILSGIAGSGKDFYISKNYPLLSTISLDDLRRKAKVDYKDSKGNGRVIQEAKEIAKQYLRSHTSFIWNATNITLQMREQLIDLLEPYKPSIKIIYLEVPYKKLLVQNSDRNFAIPASAIEKMIDKLEVPKEWEAVEVEYVVD
jgi:predicted kinase